MPTTMSEQAILDAINEDKDQISEEAIYKPVNDTSSVPFTWMKQFVQASTARQAYCKECGSGVANNCHLLDIPNFKDLAITVDACTKCFLCTFGIKTGDSISPKGRKTAFNVFSPEDLTREVIKSNSCVVSVPEIELELTAGTLGVQFTTIGNLLKLIQQDLLKHVYSIATSTGDDQSNLAAFLVTLDWVVKGEINFTLYIDDPLNNSTEEGDTKVSYQEYERTAEQTADALLYSF